MYISICTYTTNYISHLKLINTVNTGTLILTKKLIVHYFNSLFIF